MRIYLPTIADVYKDIHNKKSLLQILPRKNAEINPQKLTPVTDIDGEFVVYSAGRQGDRYVQSTRYGEVEDRMSYEDDIIRSRESEKGDFFRDNELFDRRRDFRYVSPNTQYSSDDVFAKNVTPAYRGNKVNNAHPAPDTDILDTAAKRRLDYWHFIDEILPSTFGRRIKLDAAAVEEYASAAVSAMHYDKVPLSVIIRTMEKSVLADPDGIGMSNARLFKFLLKYPNMRKNVVIRLSSGKEIVDTKFLFYYPSLLQRFDTESLKRVIKDCTTANNPEHIHRLDESLCTLVCRMKHLPPKYAPDGTLNDIPKNNFKWTNEDSEFIAKIKQADKNSPIPVYADIAKGLLQNGKDTKYILENIDVIVSYKHDLAGINEKLRYYNESQRKQIAGMLNEEYQKLFEKDKITGNDIPLLSYAKTIVGNRKIRLNETMSAYKSLVSYFNGDMEKVNKAVKLCQGAGGEDKSINIPLTKMLYILFDRTGTWDENLVKTMQKAGKLKLTNGQLNDLTKYVGQYPENSYQIICNGYEIMKRKDKINEMLDKIAEEFGWWYPRGTFSEKLEEELRLSAANKNFKANDSRLLNVLQPLTCVGHFNNSRIISDIMEHVIRKTGRLDEDVVGFITEMIRAEFSKNEISGIADDILDCKNNEAVTKQMVQIRKIIGEKKSAPAKPVKSVHSVEKPEAAKPVSIEAAGQIILKDGTTITYTQDGTTFVDLTKRHKKK